MSRPTVAHIDHVEIFVPNRLKAAGWYSETLGLEVVPKAEPWARDPRGPLMISSDDGATMVALFEGPPQGDEAPSGLRRMAFRCDGATFTEFSSTLKLEPVDHDWSWSIYFTDPWGNLLEITTYDYDTVLESRQ